MDLGLSSGKPEYSLCNGPICSGEPAQFDGDGNSTGSISIGIKYGVG